MDEALSLPTESSVQLALRTQQIIAFESGVADFVDPLGGSYAIEAMTDDLERKAEALIDRIMEQGGVLRCIESGWIKRAIADSSYRYQKGVESAETVIVGVNKFKAKEGPKRELLKVNSALSGARSEALGALKAGRDRVAVGGALEAVKQAAQGSENLMPFILAAVKAGATMGEVSGALEGVFGRYRERPEI
jgi:methylmalonyl-CoA mutase N-terminal domain/subunit